MTEATRQIGEQELFSDDAALPPAILALIHTGRQRIAEIAAEKEAAERSAQEQARARADAWLAPVRLVVESAIRAAVAPADLSRYAVYPIDETIELATKFPELGAVKGGNDVLVRLRVPGCAEIAMPVRRDVDRGWYLIPGYEFQTAGESYSELAVALAHSRAAYLKDLETPPIPF